MVAILMTRIIQTRAVKVCLWGGPMGRTFGLLQAKRGYRMQMVGTLYLTTDHRRPFTTIKKKKKGVVFDECHNPFTLKIPFVDFKKE